MTMEIQIQVTDLCGREKTYTIPLSALELPDADIEHILNEFADGRPAFIGEIEYREVWCD